MDNQLITEESNPFTATAWTGMDVTSANLVFEILEYAIGISVSGAGVVDGEFILSDSTASGEFR